MFVGAEFLSYYADGRLADDVATTWLPWLLDGRGPARDQPVELGTTVVSIAGGFATHLPADRAPRVILADLTTSDPAGLDLPDGSADGVVAMLTLQHVRGADAQTAALAEWRRVLRPGGVLVGLAILDGPQLRRLDQERRCTPVDPTTLATRLDEAGFDRPLVRIWSMVGFVARRPRS